MGMALAAKRGKGHFSGKVEEAGKSMSEKQLRDFAKTKHEGLPEKKANMTTQEQQAYVEGFVKRASEHGYTEQDITHLLKSAAFQQNMRNFLQKYPKSSVQGVQDIANTRNQLAAMIKNMRSPQGINDILINSLSAAHGTGLHDITDKIVGRQGVLDKYVSHLSGNATHPSGTTLSAHEGLIRDGLKNRVDNNLKNKVLHKLDWRQELPADQRYMR
jgi:hypothetical protein